MKKTILLLCFLSFLFIVSGQNVGIGTVAPAPSAALDVSSTTLGFLPPRMDSTQRNAIIAPATGLIIYNTSIKAFQCYNGSQWYSTVHYIGERYGGGIIFYVYDNGQHGLVAALSHQASSIAWDSGAYINNRAKADGIGAGLKNTAIIVGTHSAVDESNLAATICNEYSVTDAGVKYGDWYLPSKEELRLMCMQKTIIGYVNGPYWSSTEAGTSLAWLQSFVDCNQASYPKGYPAYVRAIRHF